MVKSCCTVKAEVPIYICMHVYIYIYYVCVYI